MPRNGWSPGIVPFGADETAYLVVDCFSNGTVYRETEVEKTDLETVISDLLTGRYNSPVRVVAFNTLEHWSEDVSADIAAELQTRCDIAGVLVPEHVRDFVEAHRPPTRQLALRLVYCRNHPSASRRAFPALSYRPWRHQLRGRLWARAGYTK